MNLKLWAVIVLLLLGMSACLNDDDDSLSIYVQYPYVLQNDNGTFTPQMQLYGYNLKSAFLNVAGERFTFSALNDYTWELPNGLFTTQLDSIPYGYYTLTATSTDGKAENLTVGFSESKKKIGEINLSKFEYNATNNKIELELADSVQNASAYLLMIKIPVVSTSGSSNYTMWLPYSNLTLSGDRKLAAEVSLSGLGEGTFPFAVGAGYGSTIRISNSISVESSSKTE